jgi:hypothetical protein
MYYYSLQINWEFTKKICILIVLGRFNEFGPNSIIQTQLRDSQRQKCISTLLSLQTCMCSTKGESVAQVIKLLNS